jgi:hypothetical protein
LDVLGEMEVGSGVRVRVLDLQTIVALKEELSGEKDLAVLPVLRRTLELKRKGASDGRFERLTKLRDERAV